MELRNQHVPVGPEEPSRTTEQGWQAILECDPESTMAGKHTENTHQVLHVWAAGEPQSTLDRRRASFLT